MKKIFLLVFLLGFICVFSNLSSYAYNPEYSKHTSAYDIEYKKKKALAWHTYNQNKANEVKENKLHWFSPNKEKEWKKEKALNWNKYNIAKEPKPNKLHWFSEKKQEEWQKARALKWHERNSK